MEDLQPLSTWKLATLVPGNMNSREVISQRARKQVGGGILFIDLIFGQLSPRQVSGQFTIYNTYIISFP